MSDQPAHLIELVRSLGGGDELVAVDLEEFFDGNHDVGSIAPNLVEHPGPQRIHEALRRIRRRADTSAVVVLVRLEFDDYPPGEWPFAEAILVVTAASLDEIDRETHEVGSDPAVEGGWNESVRNHPPVPSHQRVVTIWWD